MTDAPAVLGWQAWRELEARYGLALITDAMQAGVGARILAPAPVPALAQLVLSAIFEAGMIVAHADDSVAARTNAQLALIQLLSGLVTPTTE